METGTGQEHLLPASQDAQWGGGQPGTSASANTLAAESGYQNPSSVVLLIGHANVAADVVEVVETVALVDIWFQIPALTKGFCTEFGLRIFPLRGLLHLKGTGGVPIPYKGYIDVNLTIPGLPRYNEDVFVILDHKYGDRVPVKIGT